MWHITAGPVSDEQPPGGYDGIWHKWLVGRDGEESFTVVKVTHHAHLKGNDAMTRRAVTAVMTDGRSEVERHLGAEVPPRVIEVGTLGDPVVTPR
jgi:hypothetical protein